MAVLGKAAGSLPELLPCLPQSLASLAALAFFPSLAATCSSPTELEHHCVPVDHIALTLCVATTQEQPVAEAAAGEEAADGTAEASIWLQKSDATKDHVKAGRFTLGSRPGVVVCPLLPKAGSLQGATVCLPQSVCLLLGPGTLKLKGVTFKGVRSFSR